MRWYLGIDGGGSKTAFTVGTADGTAVKTIRRSGCSYQSIGIENAVAVLLEGIRDLLLEVQVRPEECAGCCIGLPCFGENPEMDQVLEHRLTESLMPIPLKLVNDGVVGWAGSLGGGEGIHLVAGTGSMAVGCGADGILARSGGWLEFFGDEGSCYWIGREGMSLFSKEADGRKPKGALYHIVRETFELKKDFDFIEKIQHTVIPYRDKVAAFQFYVREAADAGDEAAQRLYQKAAGELTQLVCGLKERIVWSKEPVRVSYIGGLFHAGDWVLIPLKKELEARGCVVCSPLRSAAEGALLLAIREFNNREGVPCF